MIIPEYVLYKFVNAVIQFIERDWNDHQDKTETFLHAIFEDRTLGKVNYRDQAGSIFSRDITSPQKLEVRQFFNAEQALSRPLIHITLAGESPTSGEIGLGESGELEMNDVDEERGTITPQFLQRLETNFSVIITSTNELECTLIYRSIQAGILAASDTLQLQGWNSPKISGQDLRMPQDTTNPTPLYMKQMGISGFIELQVPQAITRNLIQYININASKLI